MPRRIIKNLLTICCLLNAQAICFAQTWTTVQIDSLVNVQFPMPPQKHDAIGLTSYSAVFNYQSFVVESMNMNADVETPQMLDSIYNGFVSGIRAEANSTDVVTQPYIIGNLRGIDVTCSGMVKGSRRYYRSRGLLVNGTMYNLTHAALLQEASQSPESDTFFKSFTLKPQAGPLTQYSTKPTKGFVGACMAVVKRPVVAIGFCLLVIVFVVLLVFKRRKALQH